jgi:hypothetical protein
MPRTGIAAPKPAQASASLWRRTAALPGHARDAAVLFGHRLAARLDLIPPEFGSETPLDETDPKAVLAEWLRYLRLWAGYNPEELFALKVGAAMLLAALVALWMAVGLLR